MGSGTSKVSKIKSLLAEIEALVSKGEFSFVLEISQCIVVFDLTEYF